MCTLLAAAPLTVACDDSDGGFEDVEERGAIIEPAAFEACKAKFPDLAGYLYAPEICALVQAGTISGYPDGTFRPTQGVTRAEFAALLTSALGLDPDKNCLQTPFSDVKSGWMVRPVCAVREAGLMSGFPNGTFGPNLSVTRTQVMVTLSPLPPGEEASPQAIDLLKTFPDWSSVPAWAFERVAEAVYNKIAPGEPYSKSLQPELPARRGEVARAVYYRQQYYKAVYYP